MLTVSPLSCPQGLSAVGADGVMGLWPGSVSGLCLLALLLLPWCRGMMDVWRGLALFLVFGGSSGTSGLLKQELDFSCK